MDRVKLLDIDPDLGEWLTADERARARRDITLPEFRVTTGPWCPPPIEHGAVGLMVCSGLLAGRIRLGIVSSTELVGPGDIIRPEEDELVPHLASAKTDWRVVQDAQIALIDPAATAAIGSFPELSAALARRLLRRARCLAHLMAAQHFLRVEDRLLATLWHLANMWGRVGVEGTVVPFRLTHETLASIIGAQRPTTTTAVRALIERGLITRDERRYFVLLGDPPDWERLRVPAAGLQA